LFAEMVAEMFAEMVAVSLLLGRFWAMFG